MKHLTLTIILCALLLPCYSLAQGHGRDESFLREKFGHDEGEEKGLFAGGAFSFWNDTKDKRLTFEFAPEVGWRFNDTWAVGVMLGYEFEREKKETVTARTHSFKISPFVRYYYLHKGPFNLYLDGGAGFNCMTERSGGPKTNTSGFELGVRPGACVDLTRGLCLCLRMGFLGYRNDYFSGEEPGIGRNGFGVRFTPEELMIGLELEL